MAEKKINPIESDSAAKSLALKLGAVHLIQWGHDCKVGREG